MNNVSRYSIRFSSLFAAIACLLLLGGCASYHTLSIDSVENKATAITPRFKEAYYRIDRDKDLYFVLKGHGQDRATGQNIDQVIIIRMFWQPIGGRTTMNPAALNATFRYLVMGPKSVGEYEGAGFVRIYKKAGKIHMNARVFDGDLRLTEATASFNDNLGRSRIQGNFSAKLNDAKAFDLMAQAHRDFFARSLLLSGLHSTDAATTESATTEPAATPTDNQPTTLPESP